MAKKHIVKIKKMNSQGLVEEYKVSCSACKLELEGVGAPEAERAAERYHSIHGTKVDQFKMC